MLKGMEGRGGDWVNKGNGRERCGAVRRGGERWGGGNEGDREGGRDPPTRGVAGCGRGGELGRDEGETHQGGNGDGE